MKRMGHNIMQGCGKKKFIPKTLWALFFLLIVYIEAAVYFLQVARWPSPNCGTRLAEFYHKVLLVADPQILGEVEESWIARWDSDRFLARTFKQALDHVQPSLVIFLGDLMDEGSIASADEYSRYYKRFIEIFRVGTSLNRNQTIFLPGDNDIGGENEEVTPQKLKRFDEHFGLKPDVVNFENVRFSKVNSMIQTYPKHTNFESDKNITIVLSHMPLLGASSFFTEKVIRELKPSLIVSAHDHKAVHFVGDLESGERTLIESMTSWTDDPRTNDKWKWRFQTSKVHTNEVLVPTCSYRMGVKDTGYGLLLVDEEGDNVCYSILWLPDRLYHLGVYLCFILPALGIYSIFQIVKKIRCPR